jgi:hypothetical protein
LSLIVLRDAEAETLATAEWYESKRPGLGVELVGAVDEQLDRIRRAPLGFPLWRAGRPYRECVLRRFPYLLFLTSTDEAGRIHAFAHTQRKPGYWLGR